MSKTPQAGDEAPDFTATTDSGETIRLRDLRGKSVVLYFYPKDDTPGCTQQACGFRDSHADFESKGALVFGVSPDDEASHADFRRKYELPFTLLVDADRAIAAAYGVQGDSHSSGGVTRSHFVIDENGKIADARIDVSPADSPGAALASLG